MPSCLVLELKSEYHCLKTRGYSFICFLGLLTLGIWKSSLHIIKLIMARVCCLRMFRDLKGDNIFKRKRCLYSLSNMYYLWNVVTLFSKSVRLPTAGFFLCLYIVSFRVCARTLVCVCVCVCVLVAQLCPTLWDLMDCGPPGFSVHGILQAEILEWVAIPFPRGSFWPRDGTCVSCTADKSSLSEPPGKPSDVSKVS